MILKHLFTKFTNSSSADGRDLCGFLEKTGRIYLISTLLQVKTASSLQGRFDKVTAGYTQGASKWNLCDMVRTVVPLCVCTACVCTVCVCVFCCTLCVFFESELFGSSA